MPTKTTKPQRKQAQQDAKHARLLKDMQHKAELGTLAQQAVADLEADVGPTLTLTGPGVITAVKQYSAEEKCGEDEMGYGVPYSPYGGATSFGDAMAALEAQSQAMQMQEYLAMYQSIIGNIVSNESITDKGAAIADAASELKKLMDAKKELSEVKASSWATFAEGGKFCVYAVDADGNKTGDSIECYDSRGEGNDAVQALYDGKSIDEKAGARHNAPDRESTQAIHDYSVKLGADCGMKMLKEKDGGYRWLGWVSNKFRDRDIAKHPKGEIITEGAHKEFIAYLDANPAKSPEWWTWHTPVRKLRADWWDYSDGYLLMSGPAPESEAKAYLSDDPIAMSHGFHALERNAADGLILKYRTFEVSDLPPDVAANPYTNFDMVRKELSMIGNKQKREYLVSKLGEERVAAIEGDTEQMSKALEELGVEYKETPVATTTTTEVKTVEVVSDPTAAIEQIKELLNVAELQHVLQELRDNQTKMLATIEAQAVQIKELSKSTDEKVAEVIAPKVKPVNWGYRASEAKENVVKADDPLAKAAPDNWLAAAFGNVAQPQAPTAGGFSDGR